MKIYLITKETENVLFIKENLKKMNLQCILVKNKKFVYEKEPIRFSQNQSIEAVKKLSGGRPVLLFHSMIYFEEKKKFPGVLTDLLWEDMEEKQWNTLFYNKSLIKEMNLTYCDGKKIKTFTTVLKGRFSEVRQKEKGWESYFVAENIQEEKDKLFLKFKDYFLQSGLMDKLSFAKKEKNENIERLAQLIKNKKLILFVGAGVSANLGIPTWAELMDHIAKDEVIEHDPILFKTKGTELELMEYFVSKKKGIEDLKKWMCKEWNNIKIPKKKMKIHDYIVKLNFPVIYTTNFEHWLEKSFKEKVEVISTIEDMQHIHPYSTKIIKFHGDCEKTDLVLTEENHFERLDFESALDIRFRADLLNHSVLFIGYSLSDMNVRYMLYKLQKIKQKFMEKNTEPSIFILTHQYNEVKKEVLEKRGIITIYQDEENRGKGVEKFLQKLYDKVKLCKDEKI